MFCTIWLEIAMIKKIIGIMTQQMEMIILTVSELKNR
jgi:hypothetical protein